MKRESLMELLEVAFRYGPGEKFLLAHPKTLVQVRRLLRPKGDVVKTAWGTVHLRAYPEAPGRDKMFLVSRDAATEMGVA